MRGVNFKNYYKLFCKLNEGDTDGMERKDYRKKLFSILSDDLEKNFLGGHIASIRQIQRNDYICKLIVEYYPICSSTISEMYITLMEDVFYINDLCIKY